MSYHPPTLTITIQAIQSRLASVKRNYTDALRQYRAYQEIIWERDARGQAPREDWEEKLDTYRDRLRSLSYRHRAHSRAIAVLKKEEARA